MTKSQLVAAVAARSCLSRTQSAAAIDAAPHPAPDVPNLRAAVTSPAIRAAELAGDSTTRLALQEEARALPFGAVWDYYCEMKGVPVGEAWLAEVKRYEEKVLSGRVA